MTDLRFWDERAQRFGHTGWADPAIYHYDQRLRMAAVESALPPSVHGPDTAALDFGCGVGDFCRRLAARFGTVVGYDPSMQALARARLRGNAANVRYTQALDSALAGSYDLILAVTVLQHVLDDDELRRVLGQLASALKPEGHFVVLETFGDGRQVGQGYVRLRTVQALVDAFAEVGLAVQSRRGFYHPADCPTRGSARFRTRMDVRLLARLATWRLVTAERILAGMAAAAADRDPDFLDRSDSPTQLLVFGRSAT